MIQTLSGDTSKLGFSSIIVEQNGKNGLSTKTGYTETKSLFTMTHINGKQYCLVLKALSEYYLNEYK